MVGSVETKQSAFAMTEEQKFFYDLRGWILIPNVLLSSEIDEMKAEAYACDGSRSLRNSRGYVDSLQKLLDHPAIVGILTEILSEPPYLSDDYYSFRCENSFISIRHRVGAISNEQDSENHIPSNNLPHVVRPPQQANAMRYQVKGNKIYSGLTRVVWELEEVKAGQGGTSFLSGSHKANFNYGGPDPYRDLELEGVEWRALDGPGAGDAEAAVQDRTAVRDAVLRSGYHREPAGLGAAIAYVGQ